MTTPHGRPQSGANLRQFTQTKTKALKPQARPSYHQPQSAHPHPQALPAPGRGARVAFEQARFVYPSRPQHAALRDVLMKAKSQDQWLDTLEWLYGGNGLD